MSTIASIFTVLGVVVALVLYSFWRDDFKARKAHEYALELYKKCKRFQYEIESFGAARFTYFYKDEFETIRQRILDDINPLFIEIRVDLLVADKILLHDDGISKFYNEQAKEKIFGPINSAFREYNDILKKHGVPDGDTKKMSKKERNELEENLKNSDLYKVFFKPDADDVDFYKETTLGIGVEVVNNKYYQGVNEFFSGICKRLEKSFIGSI